MKKNKFILLVMLLVLISMYATACSFKTEKSESYTDADGNTTTTTTTNDNGNVTTETTTSSDDDDDADTDTDIPDAVQGFADNFDTLSDSDSTYVTNIEDLGSGTYKIHITDPTMYYTLMMEGDNLFAAGVTVASTDGDVIQGCFAFFVKMLAADDVTEVVEGVMGAADGTYETDFAKYGIQTDNSTDIPFITLSMARK